tara:strand:+ start:300 stop:533 length:234 start_codon:yes stop_codon:yes gene_type:complete
MKAEDKKTENEPQSAKETSSEEIWAWVLIILVMCITIIYVTRMHVDAYLVAETIQHYTLRGRNVFMKDQQLVFVNNR